MGIKLNTERNKMDYYNIEAFDATGLVKTVFTSEGHGCWLSNSEDGHRGYREVLSHLGLTSPPSSGIRTLCAPSPMPMPG